jgi:hypothetical protein
MWSRNGRRDVFAKFRLPVTFCRYPNGLWGDYSITLTNRVHDALQIAGRDWNSHHLHVERSAPLYT